jgi:2-polyprenyl-3-methyl-5-hydroxy-6-metoxy-1,4-benzoquinol methylase
MKNKLLYAFYFLIDKVFVSFDRSRIKRTKNIQLIPNIKHRWGGKVSYAEWAHVTGIFQTLLYQNLNEKKGAKILDVGCGTGLLSISAQPFLSEGGGYTGIDILKNNITFCQSHYPPKFNSFLHFNLANASYSQDQSSKLDPWPISSQSQHIVMALSVWTHLNQRDAVFYLKEVARVLKPQGKAIITFFYLDELYETSLALRKNELGRFHSTNQKKWVFTKEAYGDKNWLTPEWTKTPEQAIAIRVTGMHAMLSESGLKIHSYLPGNWKEIPGVYFQDILILEKKDEV